MATAFLSYSWDPEPHPTWVRELAGRLRSDGVESGIPGTVYLIVRTEQDRRRERIRNSTGGKAPYRHGKTSQGGCSGIAPPRHSAGQSPAADVLQRRRLCRVPQAARRVLPQLRNGRACLLPDAQSRAPHSRARRRIRLAGRARGSPSPVHPYGQLP